MEWIISLVTGAIGGNVAGAVFKNLTLGPLGNTVAGVLGGGVGTAILNAATGSAAAGGGSVVGTIASSGVGSVVVTLIAGVIKNAMAKKARSRQASWEPARAPTTSSCASRAAPRVAECLRLGAMLLGIRIRVVDSAA